MTVPNPDIHLLIPILGIYFVAGVVKGILGFGLPIITMATLPFFVSIQTAIVLSAVVQPATNVFQLVTSGGIRKAVQFSWPVILTLVPGIVLGAWFLKAIDSGTLLILVGSSIAAFSLFELWGGRFHIPARYRISAGLGFGALAGVFGALTSLNGWAFILYLLGLGLDRSEFRSTIALLFLISGFLISTSFWVIGILDLRLLILGMLALVPAFIGMWAGDKIGSQIPAALFRKVLLVSLVLIGSSIILRGLGQV